MINRICIVIVLGCCLILSATALSAGTIYVNQAGGGDSYTIHGGQYLADPGDTVLVAPGEYTEGNFYLDQSIHLVSEAGPEQTIIYHSGTPLEPAPNAFYIYADYVTVSGFTIKWGHGWQEFNSGGAFWLRGTDIRIQNNIITDNECAYGGAIYSSGAIVTITDNLIYANDASIGGAIFLLHGTAIIESNTIADNHVTIRASGIEAGGDCHAIIRYNIFYNGINDPECSNLIDYATFTDNLTFECNDVWSAVSGQPLYSGLLPDQTGTNGNISWDPLFCGELNSGNYYLQARSPCAYPWMSIYCLRMRIGKYPVGCQTATEDATWGNIKIFNR